jgi:hypothetical protein
VSDNENLLSHTHRDHVDVFVMISLISHLRTGPNSRIVRMALALGSPGPAVEKTSNLSNSKERISFSTLLDLVSFVWCMNSNELSLWCLCHCLRLDGSPPILSWGAQKMTLPATDGTWGFIVLIQLSLLSFLQQRADYIVAWSRAVTLRYHGDMSWVIINHNCYNGPTNGTVQCTGCTFTLLVDNPHCFYPKDSPLTPTGPRDIAVSFLHISRIRS